MIESCINNIEEQEKRMKFVEITAELNYENPINNNSNNWARRMQNNPYDYYCKNLCKVDCHYKINEYKRGEVIMFQKGIMN